MVCAASQCEAVEVCQPSDSAVVFFFLKVAARRHVVTQAHLHTVAVFSPLVTTWMQKV